MAQTEIRLRLIFDISFFWEIVDRRCYLNKIGRRTRNLDEAIECEMEKFNPHTMADLRTDAGDVLIEYLPSAELMAALAEVELQSK